jgi:hypothetical protein
MRAVDAKRPPIERGKGCTIVARILATIATIVTAAAASKSVAVGKAVTHVGSTTSFPTWASIRVAAIRLAAWIPTVITRPPTRFGPPSGNRPITNSAHSAQLGCAECGLHQVASIELHSGAMDTTSTLARLPQRKKQLAYINLRAATTAPHVNFYEQFCTVRARRVVRFH